MPATRVTRLLVMLLLIPILFIIVNEILFYFVYHDNLPFNYMLMLFLLITGLFTYITYISYAKRLLGLAFINIISSPILYFFFLLIFGGSTNVLDDDYLVGFILMTQLAFTIFSLVSGTILGVLIKLITSTRSKAMEDRFKSTA